jgi:hypothetical protein
MGVEGLGWRVEGLGSRIDFGSVAVAHHSQVSVKPDPPSCHELVPGEQRRACSVISVSSHDSATFRGLD